MNYPTLEQHQLRHLRATRAAGRADSPICICGYTGDGVYSFARKWAAHVADAWDEAMTVTTRAELDALPDDTVVIADDGHVRLLCHRERSWVPLPARILHLPNPASGTTTPETPESPPRGDTDRKEDGLSINPATRITDLTVGQALKAAEVFLEGFQNAVTINQLDMLWGLMFGGKR